MNSKRLTKELAELSHDGWSIELVNDNLASWHLALPGPDGSPYFGGTFLLEIAFSEDYPFSAPKLKFLTKIYHPNIDIKGSICMGLLKDDWRPVVTIAKLLLSISSLLVNPNPDDPLNVEAGRLFKDDNPEYLKKAALITAKYAM